MRLALLLPLTLSLGACVPEELTGEVDHSDDDLPDDLGPRLSDAELAADEARAGDAPVAQFAAGTYAWDAANAHAERIDPHRASHVGRDELRRSACLDAIARRWSRRMASEVCGGNDPICHRPDAGPSSLVVQVNRCWSWMRIGENVAVGAAEASLFQAFLGSPGHHENIDLDWHAGGHGKFGVGVFRRADGRVYVTQVFATRR
jgi:hypothetical protein